MSFPRVLIYGQPFNRSHGGGITLSNLFAGWDKKSIAVAAMGHLMYNVTTDICNNYYQLGNEEFQWKFPFSLLQRRFSSGVLHVKEGQHSPVAPVKSGLRYSLVNKVFYPALEWIGVFHSAKVLKMSERFKSWLSEFKPEVLYMQVSTRETVLFATALTDYLKIPSVIHFMDDWPSTLSSKGLFKSHWSKRIDMELKILLDKVDVHLSISDAMSTEYKKRYKKEFHAFHNPLNLNSWKPYIKRESKCCGDNIRILYSGRIGPGISDSIIQVASAIDSLSQEPRSIKLYIQSTNVDPVVRGLLSQNKSVIFNPTVDYDDLPSIYSEADILLIANDFSKEGRAFLKYSMPTKASEYLISGTPVLLYSPKEAAVSLFCQMHECALCVNEESEDALAKAIVFLVSNTEYRKRISENAVRVATDLFDADVVRPRFHNMLNRVALSKSPVQE